MLSLKVILVPDSSNGHDQDEQAILLFQLTLLKIRNILNEIVSLFSINDVRNVDEQIITDGLEIMFWIIDNKMLIGNLLGANSIISI